MLYSNHSLLVFSSLSYSCYKSFVSYLKKLKEIRLQSKILDNLFGHTFLYFYFYIKNIHDPPTGKKNYIPFCCITLFPALFIHISIWTEMRRKKEFVTLQLRICQCFHYKQFVRILCNSAVKIFFGLELGIQGFSKLCRQPGFWALQRCKRVCAHSEVSVDDRTLTVLFSRELSQFFDK